MSAVYNYSFSCSWSVALLNHWSQREMCDVAMFFFYIFSLLLITLIKWMKCLFLMLLSQISPNSARRHSVSRLQTRCDVTASCVLWCDVLSIAWRQSVLWCIYMSWCSSALRFMRHTAYDITAWCVRCYTRCIWRHITCCVVWHATWRHGVLCNATQWLHWLCPPHVHV